MYFLILCDFCLEETHLVCCTFGLEISCWWLNEGTQWLSWMRDYTPMTIHIHAVRVRGLLRADRCLDVDSIKYCAVVVYSNRMRLRLLLSWRQLIGAGEKLDPLFPIVFIRFIRFIYFSPLWLVKWRHGLFKRKKTPLNNRNWMFEDEWTEKYAFILSAANSKPMSHLLSVHRAAQKW